MFWSFPLRYLDLLARAIEGCFCIAEAARSVVARGVSTLLGAYRLSMRTYLNIS